MERDPAGDRRAIELEAPHFVDLYSPVTLL